MNKRVIIITGASDGIGAEAARQLHAQGARVVIVGRSEQKTKSIATELSVPYYIADFAKLSDVRLLAERLKKDYPRIDVLVNNAGGIFGKREVTVDGNEKTMQVNHLAHFLLTTLLMDILIRSKATIINTSSVANKLFSDFDINDLQVEQDYSPNKAYGNAKLENILFTKELNNRYADKGIAAVAFHPGNVATNFANDSTSIIRFVYRTPLKYISRLISPAKGADTLIWLALSQPGSNWVLGEYYVKRKISHAHKKAYDADVAANLWVQSERLVTEFVVKS